MQLRFLLAASAASLSLATALSTPAFAQETSSSVRGTVTAESGPVGGAQVRVIHTPSGTTSTTTTDADGNFSVNGLRLMSDARNIAFSLGSACGSGSGKVSHVLRAMGVSEADARASIRLGWGRYTSEQDLRAGLTAIKAAARLQGVN